jgi:hypothetical protein
LKENITVYAVDEGGNTGASETIYFRIAEEQEPEPFQTTLIAAAAVGIATTGGAASAVYYFKKKSKRTNNDN